MTKKFENLLLTIALSLFSTAAFSDEMVPLSDLFVEGGDRVLPWIRCAAFYEASANIAERNGITSLNSDLLNAENDMAVTAAILIQEFSDIGGKEALDRVYAERSPIVEKYEVFLIKRQTNSEIPFWKDSFWVNDGAVCASMRDAIIPVLRPEE